MCCFLFLRSQVPVRGLVNGKGVTGKNLLVGIDVCNCLCYTVCLDDII